MIIFTRSLLYPLANIASYSGRSEANELLTSSALV